MFPWTFLTFCFNRQFMWLRSICVYWLYCSEKQLKSLFSSAGLYEVHSAHFLFRSSSYLGRTCMHMLELSFCGSFFPKISLLYTLQILSLAQISILFFLLLLFFFKIVRLGVLLEFYYILGSSLGGKAKIEPKGQTKWNTRIRNSLSANRFFLV